MCISGGNYSDFQKSAQGRCGAQFSMRELAPGDHLFFEGDERKQFFIVESGWVKLYRTLIDGQRQVVGFCNGGSVLGLEGNETEANGCEAITPAKVRAAPLSRVGDMCAASPSLASYLLRQMGQQLGSAQAQLTTVGAQSADQRLATLLLAFAEYGPEGETFDLPMRRGEMAEFLGMRLETVSRKMSEFQRRKLVRMKSLYACELLNRDVLERLAEGEECGLGAQEMVN
jgi:CRP/FNR family transcriptional regulator